MTAIDAPPASPTDRQANRRVITIIAVIAGGCAVASAIFGWKVSSPDGNHWVSAAQGVVNSLLASVPIVWLEAVGMRGKLGRSLRRLPFIAFVLVKSMIYLAILVPSILIASWAFGFWQKQAIDFDSSFLDKLAFAGALSLSTNFLLSIGSLLGWSTLWRLVAGRYHRPRREERIFLSVDLRDSTALAERLGDVRFHALLNAFFGDVADGATETAGDIYKYVGDEVIITWLPARGLANASALHCPIAIKRRISLHHDYYLRRFGTVPAFRAVLHIGEVIAGEVGGARREIGYFGDTLNTVARMADAAKELGAEVLVSQALLDRTSGCDIPARPLAPLALRGRSVPLAIAAYAA